MGQQVKGTSRTFICDLDDLAGGNRFRFYGKLATQVTGPDKEGACGLLSPRARGSFETTTGQVKGDGAPDEPETTNWETSSKAQKPSRLYFYARKSGRAKIGSSRAFRGTADRGRVLAPTCRGFWIFVAAREPLESRIRFLARGPHFPDALENALKTRPSRPVTDGKLPRSD